LAILSAYYINLISHTPPPQKREGERKAVNNNFYLKELLKYISFKAPSLEGLGRPQH
jgi:hypothetical protein